MALDSAQCLSPRAIRCAGPVAVVSDFSIDSAIAAGDTARVVVRYTTIGTLTGDSALHYAQRPGDSLGSTDVDTVVTVRDSSGWWYLRDPAPLSAAERAAPLHEAIGEGDCEGLSQLLYWTGTRWVRLPGAD